MSKKILIAGASGLLGSKILNKIDYVANEIILLARTKVDCDERIIQIQTDCVSTLNCFIWRLRNFKFALKSIVTFIRLRD